MRLAKNAKILPLEELAKVTADAREQGRKVVHCHGVFDLMHVGHIRHFEQAKRMGDLLVVTVTPDRHVNKGPNRPVFTEHHRAWSISALACVDYVAINQWPMAIETIQLLRPHLFVKGSEFRDAAVDRTGAIAAEADAVREAGGELALTDDDVVFSSSNLLNHHFGVFPVETENFLASFAARYRAEDVIAYLERARGLKVLTVGEAIIDEYHYCQTLGKSGKEPILAARHIRSERFPGGILAVANHAAAFGCGVGMLTCLGELNPHEDFVRAKTRAEIEKIFLYMENAPTIVKQRFLESYPFQKLFEVYVMNEVDQQGLPSEALCSKLEEILPEYDLVIVADYGHGMIGAEAVELLCEKAKFLAVNTQVNAGNHGLNTVSKYRRADYICISEQEVRLDARSPRRELRELVEDLAGRLACDRIVVTRGKDGCLCYRRKEGFCEVPAFTGHIVDRVGAGDAVLAVTSLGAATEAPMEVLGFIGNCVGAQAVGVVGNRSAIERVPLARHIESILK